MSYEEFARSAFAQTHSQGETVDALMNEFIELDEAQAEALAINAFEDHRGEKQAQGEAISDQQRCEYV